MRCRSSHRVRLRDRSAPDRGRARAVGREDADDDRGRCARAAVDCTAGRLAAVAAACPRPQPAHGRKRAARCGATSGAAAGTRTTGTNPGGNGTRASVVGSADDDASDDHADHHDPVSLIDG
jgi:hypothetical protein